MDWTKASVEEYILFTISFDSITTNILYNDGNSSVRENLWINYFTLSCVSLKSYHFLKFRNGNISLNSRPV